VVISPAPHAAFVPYSMRATGPSPHMSPLVPSPASHYSAPHGPPSVRCEIFSAFRGLSDVRGVNGWIFLATTIPVASLYKLPELASRGSSTAIGRPLSCLMICLAFGKSGLRSCPRTVSFPTLRVPSASFRPSLEQSPIMRPQPVLPF